MKIYLTDHRRWCLDLPWLYSPQVLYPKGNSLSSFGSYQKFLAILSNDGSIELIMFLLSLCLQDYFEKVVKLEKSLSDLMGAIESGPREMQGFLLVAKI